MKKFLALSILILLIFYFFKDSLNYYFISDDFYYLSFGNWRQVWQFYPDRYHYIPIFAETLFGLKKIFGLNPLPFHLLSVLLHITNVVLVFFLAKKFLRNDKYAVLVPLIFAFFFSHYEVVYWVTGIAMSLMVTFYISGLISFTDYIKNSKRSSYLLYLLFLALALFTHEYAISLLAATFFYWLIFAKNKKRNLGLFFLPTFFLMPLFLLKLKSNAGQSTANSPTVLRLFASIVKSTLYSFIPNPYLIDNIPKFLLILLFLVAVFILIKVSIRNKIRLFLTLWFSVTVLFFSLTSLPQARYFYLSAIPAILITVTFLTKKNIFNDLIYCYIIFVLFSGILFLQEQKKYWLQAGVITKKVLDEVKIFSAKIDKNKNVYFINLPDHIGNPIWPAYTFRVGFQEALEFCCGLHREKIHLFQTEKNIGFNPIISEEKLNELKKNNESIMRFDTIGGI